MSFKKKIFLFSTILIVVTLALTLFLIKSSNDRAIGLEKVYDKNMVPMESLFKISLILRDIPFKMALYHMGSLPATGAKNRLIEDTKELNVLWKRFNTAFKSAIHNKKLNDNYLKLIKIYSEFTRFLPTLIATYEKDDSEEMLELLEDEWPIYQVTLVKEITAMTEYFRVSTLATYNEGKGAARTLYLFSMILGLLSLLLVLYMSYYLIRNIATPISNICTKLEKSSSEFRLISDNLFVASQTLAESSTEQASSIQETSASLEEIYGMVKRNLEGSKEASALALSVNKDAVTSGTIMDDLVISMNEVLKSNESIQELVNIISEIGDRTQIIDEIVFQTKLLSFNASVEAERAGEHGRGFAVVAHEIGNLAQMSGNAAKEISVIVKDSINKSEEITKTNKSKVSRGNDLVTKTAGIFNQVVTSSEKLTTNSKDILEGSKEQLIGLEQITIAMGHLDIVTQKNSLSSEETSESSGEAKDLANHLNDIILKLSSLIESR